MLTCRIFQTYYFNPGYIVKNDIITPVQQRNWLKHPTLRYKMQGEKSVPFMDESELEPIDGIDFLEYSGDNIAHKSPYYSESSMFYWVWRNHSHYDYLGVWAYRRFLNIKSDGFNYNYQPSAMDEIIDNHGLHHEQFINFIKDYDVIVPPLRTRDQTIRDHYKSSTDFTAPAYARTVIAQICPEYLPFYDEVFDGYDLYWWHIFVAKRAVFCGFAQWLFTILFKIEQHIDFVNNPIYTGIHQRALGYLTERLWNIYLRHAIATQGLRMREVGFSHVKVLSPMDAINPSLKK